MTTLTVNLRRDEYDVYIGRAGHGQAGAFGNPFKPGEDRTDCLTRFKEYFLHRVENDQAFREAVLSLRGQRLGCFCAPKGGLSPEADPTKARCHGQIIAAWLEDQHA